MTTREPYRELTPAALIFGVFIGATMTAAFVFVGLKLGFTLPGSTVAAILGFAVLRGALRKGSIVENNINQTVASGVNSASAGVSFTLPALFILGLCDPELRDFGPVPVILSAIAGTFLGVVFIIPLRKQMIELERLRFPSGIAVATLLRSPGAGIRQAKLLGGGFVVAAIFHVLSGVGVLHEEIEIGVMLGVPSYIPIAVGVSFASLGAGMLAGKGGLPFVFGGMLAWWVIAPAIVQMGWAPTPEEMSVVSGEAYDGFVQWPLAYSEMLRPLGIGILIGGALTGVIASAPALRAAMRSLSSASKAGGGDEMSPKVLYGGVIAAFVVLFIAAVMSGDIGIGRALLTAFVGTLWLALAGMIVAQATGMTDITPISGMSLIGVTLMFFLSGGNVIAAIILGVAVSVGIGQCADMMQDLKSGHLIGATPKRQQLAQFAVAWVGVPVAVGAVYLLWHGYDSPGFGVPGAELSAPQGAALASVIDSLRAGSSQLDKYAAGTAIGLGLGIFPISGVAVLVGLAMYLPFYITMTYGVGCFASMALQARFGKRWIGDTLVPVAAGFIIGEALTSLTIVLVQLATGAA
ncbi:MAG: OPT/YSL family transporter [Sandaracinaceae bacterium]|nr:OPT/YSL family transporter [Sandaracinaceae bacterium]